MRKYSMIFFIRQSLRGLFKNSVMSLTSVFILASCLLLMGCFGFFIFNVNINLGQLDDLMNTIVFFVDTEYNSEEEIARIQNEIAELSNVRRIVPVSRREAIDIALNMIWGYLPDWALAEDVGFHEEIVRADPMRDAFEIEYYDVRELSTLRFQLMAIEGFGGYRSSAETAEFIVNLQNVVTLILFWFLAVLFGIAIFIILNTVKLSVHSRKDEITIMRYIGATNFFILFPFLLEGVIIGVVSAVAAYALQWYIYGMALGALADMATGLTFIDFSEVSAIVFIIFISVGVVCGLLGSSISSQKHLRA